MPVVLDIRGLPETQRMLAEFSPREMQNKMRRAVRAGLKPYQQQLIFEGDSPGHPHSFTKVPAGKVSTHGGVSGREVEGYVRPKSPLFNIFEPGAGQHTIGGGATARAGSGGRTRKVRGGRRTSGMLAGPAGEATWDPGGRKRPNAFFAKGAVTHPGMRARPILPSAFAAATPAAEDVIASVIFGHSVGQVLGS